MPRPARPPALDPAFDPAALSAAVTELGGALQALRQGVREEEVRRRRARARQKARTGKLKAPQQTAPMIEHPAEGQPLIEGWVPLTELAGLTPERPQP
ncbi:MAG: hypothetical protein ACLGIN_08850 [Candidatus Sericytochromatia bacterium]